MGYYFQDQLESGSWAGLGLNTNLSATFFLLAERNLRSQHVIAEAEQQQVMGGSGGEPHRQLQLASQPGRLHKVRYV